MRRWAKLNDRQLAVLRRIGAGDSVTSDDGPLAHTVYALRDRGLVRLARADGRWTAELLDDGRFYLDHGHHPDQRQRGRPKRPAVLPAPVNLLGWDPFEVRTVHDVVDVPVNELMTELQANGGVLRIKDPDMAVRAGWRRAVNRARRDGLVPAGHHLRYLGRDVGDLVLTLHPGEHPATKSRQRVEVPDAIADVHPLVTRVGGLAVSDRQRDRVLRIVHALVTAAEERGFHGAPDQPGFTLTRRESFHIGITEGRVRVPSLHELGVGRHPSRGVRPTVPDGKLTLTLTGARPYPGRPGHWGDTTRWTLEDKLGEVITEIETRERLDQEES